MSVSSWDLELSSTCEGTGEADSSDETAVADLYEVVIGASSGRERQDMSDTSWHSQVR